MKRSELKRGRRRSKPRLSEASASIAYERSDGYCACGCGRKASEWHHVFDQNHYPELVDEPDNILAVAEYCHRRHTDAVERFDRSICKRAERFAVTPSMENYLDNHYDAGSPE